MRFVPKVFEDILQRMVNAVVSRTGISDLNETGTVKTVLAAFAREMDEVWFGIFKLLQLFSIDKASGADLDERAKDLNDDVIFRNAAIKATGSFVFSRVASGPLLNIPAGQRIEVPGANPPIVAVTTASGSIPNLGTDSAPIACTAEIPGTRGNAAANTLTKFRGSKPAGVNSVTNQSPLTGGQDRETDDSFRGRLKAYIKTLARSTVAALEFVSSGVQLVTGQRAVFVKAIEDPIKLGLVRLYVDDGAGTAESTVVVSSPELLTVGVNFPGNVAQGGEQYLYTAHKPIKQSESHVLVLNGSTTLVEGVDYTLNPASGQIFLTTPLTAGDTVTLTYTYFTGLLAQVQKVIDGDPTDRVNFPGWRAAGVLVIVLAPIVTNIVIQAGVVVDDGFDPTIVKANVQSTLASYVNGLGIGADVILNAMVERAMLVDGVFDIVFFQPTANVPIPQDQISRTNASTDITIT